MGALNNNRYTDVGVRILIVGPKWSVMKRFLIAVGLLLAASVSAGVEIDGAFSTGNKYLKFSKDDQLSYVVGVIDGLKLAPTLGADQADMKWFRGCIRNMEAEQIKALVDKFLAENPGRWHESMHTLVYAALLGPCPRK